MQYLQHLETVTGNPHLCQSFMYFMTAYQRLVFVVAVVAVCLMGFLCLPLYTIRYHTLSQRILKE